MYNIAICEDEKIHLNILLNYIKNYEKNINYNFRVDVFKSGEELIKQGYNSYDIIILDIHMHKINGIDVAKIIRDTNDKCKIVFVTALDKYSIEGYKVNAHRYILKPVQERDFIESITSIIEKFEKENAYININHKGKVIKIRIADIYYLEISNRKTEIYTKNGVYTSRTSMSKWKSILRSHGFSSCHNSFLINMNYIEEMEQNKVLLLNKIYVPISKRKYKTFKDEFTKHIGQIF